MNVKVTKYEIYYKETRREEKTTTIYHMLYTTLNDYEFIIQMNYLLYAPNTKITHVEAFSIMVATTDPILTCRELKKEVYTND